MNIHDAIDRAVSKKDLKEDEMIAVMTEIMEGRIESSELGAFLTALKMKGESTSEIVGAVRVMRDKAEKLTVNADPIVDTCGTGGDGADTFNISTAAAFVVAGAGITVAKHGNKAVSSKSGSADVLKCLGVNIEADKATVEKCLEEVGIGFLFAPLMHGAMRHAAGVRKELGFRTIFNLLGPLTNPAGAHAQVIGVYDSARLEQIASVLQQLGSRHAFVVHGCDGLDEITLTGDTKVCELSKGKIKEYLVRPASFGLHTCLPEELKGGTPEENAEIMKEVLSGKKGPKRDIVLMNASAAIIAAGKADTLEDGTKIARQSIDSGAAAQKLDDLRRVSKTAF
ncbi:MAG: anthranilate phosphoribosyltransferase [Nitrospinae bacterium]|nr:anthranilate phosphoribosyltransferase [Nitrospinota bacterium]